MYAHLPSFIIAFHGCDEAVKNDLLKNGERPAPSLNDYDWLGSGFYCWEQNEQRAMDFAKEASLNHRLSRGSIINPAVVGLVVDLGNCLNLLDQSSIELVRAMYQYTVLLYETNGKDLPKNIGGNERVLRRLDCLVIEQLHLMRQESKNVPFDTVRAMFPEGGCLYEDSGFREKNHIQICIRNENMIKAFFDPRKNIQSPFSWVERQNITRP